MAGYDSGLYDDGLYDDDTASPPVAPPVTVAPLSPAVVQTLEEVLQRAGVIARTRLSVLYPDGSPRRTFQFDGQVLTEGSVQADLRRDVRRSASLILTNPTGELTPATAGDIFAGGSRVRVERGADVSGVPVFMTLITGFVTGCSSSMRGTVSLSVESYMSALAQDAGTALVLPARTYLAAALHTLWDPVLPDVEWVVTDAAADRALGADIPVLASDSRLDVGMRLARDLGCVPYDDRAGRIVLDVRPVPSTQPVVRVMTEPLDIDRTTGMRQFNGQGVEASPGDGEPFYVLVTVDDQASPIHPDRIGLRLAPTIQSDSIPDPATARALAASVLSARGLRSDTLSVRNLPSHLDLEPGDVVERTEPISGASGRYLIETIEYPAGPGELTTTETSVLPLYVEDL